MFFSRDADRLEHLATGHPRSGGGVPRSKSFRGGADHEARALDGPVTDLRRHVLRDDRTVREARRPRVRRDRPERPAERDDHRPGLGAAQRRRQGRVLDGRVPPQAGRHGAGERQALLREQQPRSEARHRRHQYRRPRLPQQRPDHTGRCRRRVPDAAGLRHRVERMGRDGGVRAGCADDHRARRRQRGRIPDRRTVARGVRGRCDHGDEPPLLCRRNDRHLGRDPQRSRALRRSAGRDPPGRLGVRRQPYRPPAAGGHALPAGTPLRLRLSGAGPAGHGARVRGDA